MSLTIQSSLVTDQYRDMVLPKEFEEFEKFFKPSTGSPEKLNISSSKGSDILVRGMYYDHFDVDALPTGYNACTIHINPRSFGSCFDTLYKRTIFYKSELKFNFELPPPIEMGTVESIRGIEAPKNVANMSAECRYLAQNLPQGKSVQQWLREGDAQNKTCNVAHSYDYVQSYYRVAWNGSIPTSCYSSVLHPDEPRFLTNEEFGILAGYGDKVPPYMWPQFCYPQKLYAYIARQFYFCITKAWGDLDYQIRYDKAKGKVVSETNATTRHKIIDLSLYTE